MRKIIIAFITLCFCKSMYAQLPLKSEGFTSTQHGYLFYENGHEDFQTFVPVKSESIKNDLSNFKSEKLGFGYQLNNCLIIIDSLKRYGKTYKLENGRTDSSLITIIPFTLTYSIPAYAKRKDQMDEYTITDVYKIANKLIKVRTVGFMSLRIISSTPKLYYWEFEKISL